MKGRLLGKFGNKIRWRLKLGSDKARRRFQPPSLQPTEVGFVCVDAVSTAESSTHGGGFCLCRRGFNRRVFHKTIVKNGFSRSSQLYRNLPTRVRITPRGSYRQRLRSAENSTCRIGKSIALSVTCSPKMGRCGDSTGDFLPISGIDGSIFRRFVFPANSAPQRNCDDC